VDGLQRFKDAQDASSGGFGSALAELRAGRKQGHWIWYIFPQLAGLGSSPQSMIYGIAGVEEAVAYLDDRVLRTRLIEAAAAVADNVRAGRPLAAIMASEIDVRKLVSSLTLFGRLAEARAGEMSGELQTLATIASSLLAQAEVEGYLRCVFSADAVDRYFANGPPPGPFSRCRLPHALPIACSRWTHPSICTTSILGMGSVRPMRLGTSAA
jgi:uncharacterized protein (DUF1810 family)